MMMINAHRTTIMTDKSYALKIKEEKLKETKKPEDSK